jgi:hypothetical protein
MVEYSYENITRGENVPAAGGGDFGVAAGGFCATGAGCVGGTAKNTYDEHVTPVHILRGRNEPKAGAAACC